METVLAMGVLGWAIGLVVGSPAGARGRARAVPWRELVARGLGPGPDGHGPVPGHPPPAGAALGRRIVGRVAEPSRPYGTVVRYLEGENAGRVDLGRETAPASTPVVPSPR